MSPPIQPETKKWFDSLDSQTRNRFLAEIAQKAAALQSPLWTPLPGPQEQAYNSEADILGYGGSSGGGKTDLLLGLAATKHSRSVIFRRVFPSLREIIERSREIFNPQQIEHFQDSYNESLHRWTLSNRKMLEFESCQYEKDREKQRGRPRDFYGFDEVTEFARSQFEFITAWNRSVNPRQRCRVVMTFNPPSDETGTWICDYFLPWLAHLHPDEFTYPNPAQPGEIRWFAVVGGESVEVESGDSFEAGGETIHPQSRTFIPAKLEDNPYLAETNYRSVLQSLPEPLRSQMLDGDFAAAVEPDEWQVIPTRWIKLAMQRGGDGKPEVSLTGVSVDVARGGKDKTVISKRYGNLFPPLKVYQGRETPDGPTAAVKVVLEIGEEKPGYIHIDVIGYGSSAFDSVAPIYNTRRKIVQPINVADASEYVDKSGKFKMRNQRAEAYWRCREALDPIHGDDIILPDDTELLADLAAPRFFVTTAGIQVEEKENIKKRIGRSPDMGDALVNHFLVKKRGMFFG